jgi:hypothetical protein
MQLCDHLARLHRLHRLASHWTFPADIVSAALRDRFKPSLIRSMTLCFAPEKSGFASSSASAALLAGSSATLFGRGQFLRHATEPMKPEVIERFVELWNNRLEAAKAGRASGEIRAFSWWFFTSYFDDEWALKSLHAGLKLTDGELELIMDSLGRLSKLAGKYPTMVVECVQMITNASPDYVELWTSDIVTMIKLAFGSHDPAAHVAGRKLIGSLGVRGHLGFRNLLAEDPSVGNQS